jgi:transposase
MDSKPRDWREARRLQAWELKHKGWSQRDIAEALGVTEGAVSQWMKRGREGQEALRHRKSPGAPRRLTEEQLRELPALLQRGAESFGFRGEVWTRQRVGEILRERFGVSYHPSHVGRILRKVGWTLQRPVRRARQRDEKKITEWREQKWPELKKGLSRPRKPSSSLTSRPSTLSRQS